MNAQLAEDIGGSLLFDPSQPGLPSAASVTLYKSDGTTEVAASQSATIDTVNTTVAVIASAGSSTMQVASASSFDVGRRYYVASSTKGYGEWLRVMQADTATSIITMAAPLDKAYAVGDAVTGNRLTVSVSAANAATRDRSYQAAWIYTIDGQQYRARTMWDVVKQPWPDVVLSPWEFGQYAGAMGDFELELTRRGGLQFADEITDATERMRLDILDGGHRPDLFLSFDAFKRPVAQRVRATWAEDGLNIPASFRDDPDTWDRKRTTIYDRALSQALNTTGSYDESEDLGISVGERDARRGQPRVRL